MAVINETAAPPAVARAGLGRLLTMLLPATAAGYALFNGIQAVILPAQVERFDPGAKVGNLALLTVLAAIASMIAIPAGGAISDRTRSRFGRRTPWIALSAVASGILAIAMGLAPTLPVLAVVITALWFAANFFGGATAAILPDRVPVDRRGLASAVIGLGTPIGVVIGVNLASRVSTF